MAESTNSCGTTYCPATKKAKLKSNGHALLRELDRVRSLLAAKIWPEANEMPLLVMARFVKGISLPEFIDLTKDLPENSEWVALSLDASQYGNLTLLVEQGFDLKTQICPFTGVLQDAALVQQFGLELERVEAAQVDLSCVLFELDKHFTAFAQMDLSLGLLARIIKHEARVSATLGRVGDRLALILPKTGPFQARALAERVIVALQDVLQQDNVSGLDLSLTDNLPIRAGISYIEFNPSNEKPIKLPSSKQLLDDAAKALILAKQGFTRTFKRSGADGPEQRTQVQACEKQFLFFGDTE